MIFSHSPVSLLIEWADSEYDVIAQASCQMVLHKVKRLALGPWLIYYALFPSGTQRNVIVPVSS